MPLRTLLLGLLVLTAVVPRAACAERAAETALREAVVFNLVMFVEWPERSRNNDELRLCAVDAGLAGINGRKVRDRRLTILQINRDLGDLHRCDAFFADAANRRLVPAVAAREGKGSLLVIAEGEQMIEQGATIALTTVGGRMAFDVNLGAARAANLTISSKLLRLARRVSD